MKITVNADGTVAGMSQNENEQPIQQRSEGNPYGTTQNNTSKPIFLKWHRERLYDRAMTLALYESCLDAEEAEIISLTGRPKNKWRPIPLATVELQKRASRYLRIGSETLMTAAEELYQQGLISYPRTETEIFRPEFQHMPLIQSFQGLPGELGE
jgi:DNA topoisomerase III